MARELKGERLEIEKYLDGEIGEIPLARKENIGRTEIGRATCRERVSSPV